jgi:protein kinase C substrate 80K-H
VAAGKPEERTARGRGAVRGVSPEEEGRYTDAAAGFVCDHGAQRLPLTAVNDEFCDCSDGSDEPGTAACAPRGRFYCTGDDRALPSSVVDDGVCDCCDGSDEPAGACPATGCAGVHAARADAAARRAAGQAKRAEYVARGLALASAAADGAQVLHGGPEGAFAPLAGACFHGAAGGEYEYEVCFFDGVTQRDRAGAAVSLGSEFAWVEPGVEARFDGGAPCPGGQPRSARILFACALEDAVQAVSEPERCAYDVVFGTPAACAS